jgi:hypothetical protein
MIQKSKQKGLKGMKRLLVVLTALFMFYARSILADDDIGYYNNYAKALRVASTISSHSPHTVDDLTCKKNNGRSIFFTIQMKDTYRDTKEKYREEWEKLESEGIDVDEMFIVSLKKYNKENQLDYIIDRIGIIHIDTSSRFHFSFPSDPTIINLELTDPNMKLILDGKLPKNSRVYYEDYGSAHIKTDSAVYLWENNAADQKMICDIYSQVIN